MPTTINLSEIWEDTLTYILNHGPKTEMGIIMRAWVKHNRLEDFNSLLSFTADDFTPSGSLCCLKGKADSEVVTMMPNTTEGAVQAQSCIQYLILECE